LKYNSDQIQDKYHRLAVDLQVEINELEDKLADLGYIITVANITNDDKELNIVIRVAN